MPLPETIAEFVADTTLTAAQMNQIRTNLSYLDTAVNAQIQIGAQSFIPMPSYPASPSSYETSVYLNTYNLLDFPDTTTKYANAVFELPADYDGGTMTAHFNWTANSTSTNSVVWFIRAVSIADDEALDVDWGTAVSVVDANKSTAYKLNKTGETSAVTIAGTPAAGELCSILIYRDPSNGSDTLAATARLISVVLTYTRT